jgi:hypothetical protein
MATWKDVSRIVAEFPETTESVDEDGKRKWRVRGNLLAWERPLKRADLEALGDAAPTGAILAVRTVDVGAKEALVADEPERFFTTPHFNGHPSVLVRLSHIRVGELRELIEEAWLIRVPRKVAKAHLDSR